MKETTKFKAVCGTVSDLCGRFAKRVKTFLFRRDDVGNYLLFDSVGVLICWSMILELIIETLSRHSLWEALLFLIQAPYAFAFSALIIFFTLSLTLLTPLKAFLQALISVLWLAMGVANCVLLMNRVTPFTPVDITLISSVFRIFTVYLSVVEIILIIALIVIALAGLIFLVIKAPRSKIKWKSGVIAVVLSGLLIPGGYQLGIYTSVLSDRFPNIAEAYKDYGLPYCFMMGIFDQGIDEPENYSENEMDSIISVLSKLNAEQETAPENSPNVIYLQLESFFDVNYLTNVKFSENPVPYFTKLKSEYTSGFLSVPSVGAGTVNTEFEILTGMCLDFFGPGEYPYKTVLMDYTCETAAYNLKELGYATHAIHNYEGTFYDRNLVYRNLGFDTFTSMEYMQDVEYNVSGSWPKDEILVGEIIDTLSITQERDFVMAVSVQGHGKYPPASLPEGDKYPIEATFIDGKLEGGLSDISVLSYYVSQLKEMDEFLRQLVEALEEYPEEVMLVMYGDHLPSLSISPADLSNEDIFQTEYVIYTNYEIETEYDAPGDLEAFQLGAVAMEIAGLHRGILTRYHQSMRGSEDYMEKLWKLSYDMLGDDGDRFVYDGNKERYPAVNMQMGIHPIEITDVDYDLETGLLTVNGTNFTRWSQIELDGEDLYAETVWVNSSQLTLQLDETLFETLRVVQYSPNGEILSATKAYVYAAPAN